MKKFMKRIGEKSVAALSLLLLAFLLGGCGKKEEMEEVRVAALKGPTAMGMVQMMEEAKRSTGVEITWQIEPALKGFNKDEEDIIYRIVQESITNAIRHGKADKVRVWIDRDFNMLKIHIEDNGVGCVNVQKGFGLHHMEERLEMLKGSLSYHGDHGFVIDAGIPIRWGTEEEDD